MRMFGRIGLVFGLFFVIVGAIYGITNKEYEGFPLLLMTAGGFTLLAVWALWMFRRARREADAGAAVRQGVGGVADSAARDVICHSPVILQGESR